MHGLYYQFYYKMTHVSLFFKCFELHSPKRTYMLQLTIPAFSQIQFYLKNSIERHV